MDNVATHWFAVQAANGSLELFGPYTLREANDARQTARTRPTDALSTVFAAANRHQAERNAIFYLPRNA